MLVRRAEHQHIQGEQAEGPVVGRPQARRRLDPRVVGLQQLSCQVAYPERQERQRAEWLCYLPGYWPHLELRELVFAQPVPPVQAEGRQKAMLRARLLAEQPAEWLASMANLAALERAFE